MGSHPLARRALAAVAALLLAACAQIDIPAIDLHRPVVHGGQAQIDAGQVVDVDGLPGIWIAAHRTTHGAVFARLPELQVGDQVCIYSGCYHVVRIIRWPSHQSPGYIGTLVLQTSLSGGGVLLVVCEPG